MKNDNKYKLLLALLESIEPSDLPSGSLLTFTNDQDFSIISSANNIDEVLDSTTYLIGILAELIGSTLEVAIGDAAGFESSLNGLLDIVNEMLLEAILEKEELYEAYYREEDEEKEIILH